MLVLATACSEPADTLQALGERLIDEDPQVVFRPEDLVETTRRFQWNLDDPAEAVRWTGSEAERRAAGRGVPLAGRDHPATIARAIGGEIDPDAIQRLEVRVNGLGRAPLKLLWARRGEELSEERSLETKATPGNPVAFSFEVGDAPLWSGRIGTIALAAPSAPPAGVRVRKVLGYSRDLSEDSLLSALTRPWKVDLGGDVRNAFLAPPGNPIVREVRISAGARLRFDIGAVPEPQVPVRFRVFAERPGGERRMLSQTRLSETDDGWTEAYVDLADAGISGTARIVLETEAEGPLDLTRSIPVFGDPRLARPAPAGDEERVNVVLISIDTLRADRLSLAGYERATTPHLDRWAETSAVVFENAVAQAPWTLPSHASMLSGIDALRHGVNYLAPAPPSLELVAERFRRAGYATAAFTAGGFVAPEFGLTQGFDRYVSRGGDRRRPLAKLLDTEIELGIEQVERWLRQDATRPFFLFFHTYEVHSPYHAREPWFGRFGGARGRLRRGFPATEALPPEPDSLVTRRRFARPAAGDGSEAARPFTADELADVNRMYDSGVAYMDEQMGELFELLEELGLDRTTVVVFTSDHGEALGERQMAAHTHLYDETIRVPLIVGLPEGRGGGHRVRDQVRSIDIVPTLLELAGLPAAAEIDGASLVALLEGRTDRKRREAWSYAGSTNVGVSLRVGNRLKYIHPNVAWPGLLGRDEIYDLARDPAELRNLAQDHPDRERLESRTVDRLARDLPGVRVRLTNGAATWLSGEVRGPVLRSSGVSSFDLDCRCVEWLGGGRIRYRVAPGDGYTLVLEHAAEGVLAFEGGFEGEGQDRNALAFEVDLDTLAGPFAYAWDGAAWGSPDDESPVSTGFVVEAGRAVRSSGTPEDEPEVLEQLRALGYVH